MTTHTPQSPIADGDPSFTDWLRRAASSSEMARMVADFDWAATPLGAPHRWPAGLQTAVRVCLSTRFPMLVVWGPDLIKIYNDGYRDMLGNEKHPMALGAPARVIWGEIWSTVGPEFESVMATTEPTWMEDQLLVVDRNGYLEECHFTYSYSPLFDDDGSVGGVLDVAVETSDQVRSNRRLACVAALTEALVAAENMADIYRSTASVLRRWRADVPAVDVYQRAGEAHPLVASNRRPGSRPADDGALAEVATRREPLVVGDAVSSEGTAPARHYVITVGRQGDGVACLITFDLNPRLPFDDDYRGFLELLSRVVGTAVDSAYRRSVEAGEQRRLSEAIEVALLRPASDFPTVAARYLPADGSLAIGGDWYDVIDLGDERRGIIVGDCVGHGLDAAAVMAQLRSASRAMLMRSIDPAVTLATLDSLAFTLQGAMCATAVCAVIDRRTRTLTYSRAGHVPPLVVAPDGIRWLEGASGLPLGVDTGVMRTNETTDLDVDSMLIVYTDGLIERRDHSLDTGLQRLAAAAVELHGSGPAQHVADGLLRELVGDDVSDDVVLVVKQLLSHEGESA